MPLQLYRLLPLVRKLPEFIQALSKIVIVYVLETKRNYSRKSTQAQSQQHLLGKYTECIEFVDPIDIFEWSQEDTNR